jgi:hypothetical protein
MPNEEEHELEEFIQDWYWDDRSHIFARELGKYIFQFIDTLYVIGPSKKTLRKHIDNCWAVGLLECAYGYKDRFDPMDVFSSEEPGYEYEFKRKISDSRYSVASYRTTWRKLYKHTKALRRVLEE